MHTAQERKEYPTVGWFLLPFSRFFRWWYARTTFVAPVREGNFALREIQRRSYLLSTLVFLSILVLLIVLLGGIFDRNGVLLLVISFALLIQGIAILLNRRGKVNLAGLLITVWFTLGLQIFLLTIPGGLSVANLPALYLFVEPELLAVSLLPAWSVFVLALYNCLSIGVVLAVLPHTAELNSLLANSGYQVIFQPIILQLMVAVVCYLWVRSAQRAIVRADRAEEIASLQQTIAEQNRQRLEAVQAERQITLAYEQQRKMNELKDQFLVNVSHELRTPLTGIGGYLELLNEHDEELDPLIRKKFITQIIECHEELVNLTNRVLEALAAEELPPLQQEACAVHQLIQDVLVELNPQEVEQYTICLSVAESIMAWGDPKRVRQVLRNLLGNVFNYAPKRSVVSIEARQLDPSSPISISVQDEGPGIRPEDRALVFEKFVRLPRDLAGATRGTGLGLYICRYLVETMGGHIWVESSGHVGEGSRFCFTLPSPPSPLLP